MKVLILKPSSLGDVVQAIPVARLLKRHAPKTEIHWWLNRELVPLLAHDPDISRVIPFDRRRWATLPGAADALSVIQAVRREKYDLVIDLQCLARSALMGWVARGGLYLGLEDGREGSTALYDQVVPAPRNGKHAVDRYLEVLRALQIPVDTAFDWLPVNAEAATVVEAVWPQDGRQWILFQPGARWSNKRWPSESFGELARRIIASCPNAKIAVLGSEADRAFGLRISQMAGPSCLDLTGRLNLPGMVEWIRRARVMVTNDTGPMHVAAAVGTPIVAIFGPTDPARTGPYGQLDSVLRTELPCAPCLKATCTNLDNLACLKRVEIQQVFDQVLARLGP